MVLYRGVYSSAVFNCFHTLWKFNCDLSQVRYRENPLLQRRKAAFSNEEAIETRERYCC
jgi:hypothetical protein